LSFIIDNFITRGGMEFYFTSFIRKNDRFIRIFANSLIYNKCRNT